MRHTQTDFRSWLWVLALAIVLSIGPEAATAGDPGADDIRAGSLLLRTQDGYSRATLLNSDVAMRISGLVARVSVRQEFRNESADWVEALYVFPLPDRAAVDRMRLHIGERFIEGEIQEAARAKKTYEEAKKAGKKTSLVEQQRANLFTTAVANIAPGERVVIEIEYLEDVRYEAGQFSIRFPMTLTPRYVSGKPLADRVGSGWSPDTDEVPDASLITPPQVSSSNDHRVTLTATVNAGMPLASIVSRYHPVDVSENNGMYTATLAARAVSMDHDFELVWKPVPSAQPRAMSFTETVGSESYYLLMLMPPDQDAETATRMPREVIFIVDTSGSMHGASMSQAKHAVQFALKGLEPGDRFNVIEFDSTTNTLFAVSQPANESNLAVAKDFVHRLEANGGTEMRPALSLALDSPTSEAHLRQVVFITDGSVGYEDALFSMIEDKLRDARLFTVGIGSAPNSWFMRKAAEVGRGSYTFISALHEVQEKMQRMFQKLEQPQVTDIELAWPSGNVVDSFPSIVPDLYLGEPVTVKVAANGAFRNGDRVRISGTSIDGGWSAELPVDAALQSVGVGALWARARIGELMDAERRGTDPDGVRAVIVDTALRHHLVSKYTSLVAVDKTPARAASEPLTTEQVPNLLPYGQSANAIFGLPATATNAPMLRTSGIVALLAAMLLLALRQTLSARHCVRSR